jgi:hypothetical protein
MTGRWGGFTEVTHRNVASQRRFGILQHYQHSNVNADIVKPMTLRE